MPKSFSNFVPWTWRERQIKTLSRQWRGEEEINLWTGRIIFLWLNPVQHRRYCAAAASRTKSTWGEKEDQWSRRKAGGVSWTRGHLDVEGETSRGILTLTRVSSSLRANVLTIAPYAMPAPCPPVQAPPFHVKAVGRACPRCSLCRTSKHRGVAVGGREERRRRRPPLAAHTPPLERAGLPLQP